MSHILVGFSTKKNDWISKAICWFSGWRHSHVVLISPDRQSLIESTAFPFPDHETGAMRDGVREVPITWLMNRYMVEVRSIPHPDPDGVWAEAKKLVAERRKYDHEYIGAWLLRRGDGDTKKLACQEVVTESCAAAGGPLFPEDARFLTPRDLYLISKEI